MWVVRARLAKLDDQVDGAADDVDLLGAHPGFSIARVSLGFDQLIASVLSKADRRNLADNPRSRLPSVRLRQVLSTMISDSGALLDLMSDPPVKNVQSM